MPTSPRQQRKNEGSPKRMKEEPKNTYSDPPPPYPYPHPTTTVRQDTAAVAATVATENERVNGVDEVNILMRILVDSFRDQYIVKCVCRIDRRAVVRAISLSTPLSLSLSLSLSNRV